MNFIEPDILKINYVSYNGIKSKEIIMSHLTPVPFVDLRKNKSRVLDYDFID